MSVMRNSARPGQPHLVSLMAVLFACSACDPQPEEPHPSANLQQKSEESAYQEETPDTSRTEFQLSSPVQVEEAAELQPNPESAETPTHPQEMAASPAERVQNDSPTLEKIPQAPQCEVQATACRDSRLAKDLAKGRVQKLSESEMTWEHCVERAVELATACGVTDSGQLKAQFQSEVETLRVTPLADGCHHILSRCESSKVGDESIRIHQDQFGTAQECFSNDSSLQQKCLEQKSLFIRKGGLEEWGGEVLSGTNKAHGRCQLKLAACSAMTENPRIGQTWTVYSPQAASSIQGCYEEGVALANACQSSYTGEVEVHYTTPKGDLAIGNPVASGCFITLAQCKDGEVHTLHEPDPKADTKETGKACFEKQIVEKETYACQFEERLYVIKGGDTRFGGKIVEAPEE